MISEFIPNREIYFLLDSGSEVPSMSYLVVKTIIILVVFAGILILMAKYGPRLMSVFPAWNIKRGSRMKVLEMLPVEPGKNLYLIEIDGKTWLFTSTAGALQKVDGMDFSGKHDES
ncbi:MAG: hypothetical protein JXR95_00905 [Deltaproteobacteria bacterium]|nr:hypothetical protein [Deltaproteobacteria bacterium]